MDTTSITKRRRAATLVALVLAAATGAGAAASALGASGSPAHAKPVRHGTTITPAATAWYDNESDGCRPTRLTHPC